MNKKKISFRAGPVTPARFWNMAEVDGDTAELTLYGDVVSSQPIDWWTGEPVPGNYISPEGFLDDLEKIKDKSVINVKINSVGGDVYTGIAIHNALKSLPGQVNVIVEGIAASAASVIAMAGKTIKMHPGSLMMIHGVAAFICDYMQIGDVKKLAKGMDALERAIAAIYATKTGMEETTLRTMMERETWMTGQEAIDKGFADELLEGSEPQMQLSASDRLLFVNGVKHNIDGLTVPERFNIPKLAAVAQATVDNKNKSVKGEKTNMTIEELRASHPELVAQIEQEAVAADRLRIQEIEEIQNTIGDAELIAAAKFTKPTNAANLALQAMKKQAALGTSFMQNRADEVAPAAAVPAAAAPEETPEAVAKATKAVEEEAIKNVAETFKNIFG